jgi:hypothetical protein
LADGQVFSKKCECPLLLRSRRSLVAREWQVVADTHPLVTMQDPDFINPLIGRFLTENRED